MVKHESKCILYNEQFDVYHNYLCICEHKISNENLGTPDRMLQFFEYEHLPEHLQPVSSTFHELAHWLCGTLPMNPERTVALRKLLEAKDCAVRALLYKP